MSNFLKYFLVLLVLILIGIIAHRLSFRLALYGDDWMNIYNYNAYPNSNGFLSSLPGILRYLAPYGFSVYFMGTLYKIFGTQYQLYFICAFLLKIFVSFSVYLVCSSIFITAKNKLDTKSLLISIFVLVGFTGIQNTDWAFYMSIYLATAFYLLGTYFYLIFYKQFTMKMLLLSLIMIFAAILTGPVRLFPLVFIIPVFDIYMYLKTPIKAAKKKIIYKLTLFSIILATFWASGLFGTFFRIYSFGDWSFDKFRALFLTNPFLMIKTLFFRFSITVVPDQIISNNSLLFIVGVVTISLIIYFAILALKADGEKKLQFLFGFQFLIFTILAWYYLPITLLSSEHRYLYLPFICFCLWLFVTFSKSKIFYPILIILISLHFFALQNFYGNLLSHGRSSNYINKLDYQMFKDFPKSIDKDMMIYLESEDVSLTQSVIFGLSFKILVFQKRWDVSYFPNIYIEKKELINAINIRAKSGEDAEKIISRLYAYKLTQEGIANINTTELLREISYK